AEELEDGNVICIFPEGELTRDGQLGPIKPGILKTIESHPVPVIPIRIDGLWGSFFSRKDNLALKKHFRRVWSRVVLTVYPALSPEQMSIDALEARLSDES
ncbi:MAG: 1-acyl-sn-glycerol-3-phosphate acyltransferase, partial [Polyangiales bacterium]